MLAFRRRVAPSRSGAILADDNAAGVISAEVPGGNAGIGACWASSTCGRRYRHLAARERCGRSLPMRAPQPWPFSSETDWRLWRGHLDDVQMPHLATLKREADAEIARIVRCRYGRREPKRPAAVPPQRLPLTDAR